MECGQCCPSQPFVVLTVEQFVGHGGGPLERERQDSHVYRKTVTLPLIFRKNQSRHYINDIKLTCDGCEDEYMNTIVFIFTSITCLRLRRLCETVGL